jgi:hypothetical protein
MVRGVTKSDGITTRPIHRITRIEMNLADCMTIGMQPVNQPGVKRGAWPLKK